jgi:hypothetical protein
LTPPRAAVERRPLPRRYDNNGRDARSEDRGGDDRSEKGQVADDGEAHPGAAADARTVDASGRDLDHDEAAAVVICPSRGGEARTGEIAHRSVAAGCYVFYNS